MLIIERNLSRESRDEIRIGRAKVKLLGISGRRVRLGIDAPKGTKILRGELVLYRTNWVEEVVTWLRTTLLRFFGSAIRTWRRCLCLFGLLG
jgi:carbon storage regulator CsrA